MIGVAELDEFEDLYAAMGGIGWPPDVVDGMEAWQVWRFLGDPDAGVEPVIAGSRGLALPSDDQGDGKGKKKFRDRSIRKRARKRSGGRLLTGDEAKG